MFLFGHLGITLGIAFLFFRILKIEQDRRLYLFVLTGAILPDLIDKPVGEILLTNSISNGRLFAHTLLFAFILLLIGTYLYKRNGSEEKGVVFLSFASFIHLCEDQMWLSPKTLFYPVFGFDFPQGVVEEHWWDYFLRVFFGTYSPLTGAELSFTFVSELIGISILLIFIFYYLYRTSISRWSSR
ncbi:MAG: metal-dependent hydrolase [Methanophagales archaeon]|nr:metal-dependent hydrolase [Methanophagales archaeon]